MKHIIFKRNEDGSLGNKLGSYEGPKDDSSTNRSYLEAEPLACHLQLPEGMDEDCIEALNIEGLWVIVENEDMVAEKAAKAIDDTIAAALDNAIAFGSSIMKEFTRDNIKMGITVDGMTGTVRKNMSEVILALTTGSLYDAIAEAKAVPAEDKDAKYITDARLLAFVNKIEAYLGVSLSEEL